MADQVLVVEPYTRKILNLESMDKKVLRQYARKADAKFPELQKQVLDFLGTDIGPAPIVTGEQNFKPPWVK
jgi:hypothetical protein